MKLRNKKTGEIIDGGDYLNVYDDLDHQGKSWHYNSLAELNADWEDYVPPEPLIKDEKIREAVRAWAEANEIEDVAHYTFGDELADFRAWDKFGKECDIMFYRQVGLDEARHYTIDELCGEEE